MYAQPDTSSHNLARNVNADSARRAHALHYPGHNNLGVDFSADIWASRAALVAVGSAIEGNPARAAPKVKKGTGRQNQSSDAAASAAASYLRLMIIF